MTRQLVSTEWIFTAACKYFSSTGRFSTKLAMKYMLISTTGPDPASALPSEDAAKPRLAPHTASTRPRQSNGLRIDLRELSAETGTRRYGSKRWVCYFFQQPMLL